MVDEARSTYSSNFSNKLYAKRFSLSKDDADATRRGT